MNPSIQSADNITSCLSPDWLGDNDGGNGEKKMFHIFLG